MLIYEYKLCQCIIIRTDSIKDLRVFLDSKLNLHNNVNYIFLHSIISLSLLRSATFSLSPLGCM
jgi:hypothetical protein